jgi:mannitol-1-phosphate/altronate dehydrogenase
MDATYWLRDGYRPLNVCFGSGRFLRSVLVPALQDDPPVVVQTRGRSFMDHCTNGNYEVDTVEHDGTIQTAVYRVAGVFSLGTDADSVYRVLAPACKSLRILGVGVTEQGLANADSAAMKDLYRFLQELTKCHDRSVQICVINTDNVPHNGRIIQSHMEILSVGDPETRCFLDNHVVFLNSMVDRITSHRPDDPMVPRAEPVPQKALVILDERAILPQYLKGPGVVRRDTLDQFSSDIALKLRIANGTHTAIAQVMALCAMVQTDSLNDQLLSFLDSFVKDQVIAAVDQKEEAIAVWEDWRSRLTHKHFGLSTFFITQNAAAKGGIRFGPTVVDLIQSNKLVTQSTAFAYAVLLRWITGTRKNGVFRGTLCRLEPKKADTVSYADGLQYNLAEGWYDFRCACKVDGKAITEWLEGPPKQPEAYKDTIRMYLIAPDGGNLGAVEKSPMMERLVGAVAVLYARMVAGDDPLVILDELQTMARLDKGI